MRPFWPLLAAVIVGIAAIVGFVYAAHAQSPCGPSLAMGKLLSDQHNETPLIQGIAKSDGRLMRVYVDPKSRTWTITMSSPEGVTCFMSAGDGLEYGEKPKNGRPM